MSTPTSLTSVSCSDWLNGILHSTSGGEIMAIFPNQLAFNLDTDKKIIQLRWVSFEVDQNLITFTSLLSIAFTFAYLNDGFLIIDAGLHTND